MKSILAVDDDEARSRIKEISERCETLLGDGSDDLLLEGEDTEIDCDPELEKALFEMRRLVVQVSGLRRIRVALGMVRGEIPRRGTFRPDETPGAAADCQHHRASLH